MKAAGGACKVVYQQDAQLLDGRARALRLRRRLRAAGDRGRPATRRPPAAGSPRTAGAGGRCRRRVRARLPRRGHARRPPAAPAAAPADPLGASGTYMVWRKLLPGRRAVAALDRATRPSATAATSSKLAAKVVGRWPNGAPLETHPNGPRRRVRPGRARRQRLSLRRGPRRAALPARRAHPPLEPARRARPRRRAEHAPPDDPARDAVRRAAARGRAGRRRHRARPRVRELPGEHRAPVRGRAGAVAQRRQHLRPRPRQGLPARRRIGAAAR